jgi:signal peptidase II
MKLLFISIVVFALDQFTKWVAQSKLALRESIEVFGDTVRWTHIQNQGMAFGIAIPNKYIFNALSVFAACAILYYLIKFRNEKFLPRFALAIIFGGAIGNLLDRIMYGRVTDFIDVDIPDLQLSSLDMYFFTFPGIYLPRWPIFNIADIAVSTGMFLLMYTILTGKYDFEQDLPTNKTIAIDESDQKV